MVNKRTSDSDKQKSKKQKSDTEGIFFFQIIKF